ncbi:mannose-1-phosphate guanylyltransferase/mannose-6-phosphate isomerase [Megamonas rupellensis]|uniref:mannose-1-phosphate guanylyltransferase/mannose-6-phosphate isomerase n=1 Tax=Megamonas rupellensis TaxID=491921 RepID=UPI001959C6F0|nr:mannose-1-phosphate guanylyltransferase/mannose-6-phosphate isomerase [Megamonas rupellensis]MBM6748737.1 mannose-1-phosphate guanylyltransferase/mannose-6-phosphate isomerase [Megamonas rupellensis]
MKVIILAGGGGTRLFPLSRDCYPKQFLHVIGDKSLLAQTIERLLGLVEAKDIIIVTNERYIFHVQAELKIINAQEAHIITEPMGKNTAPAIALAQSYCQDVLQCDDDEILFVSPSDHLIKPIDAFQNLIRNAQDVAKDNIITLGIKPTKPEIGYGYIEAEKNNNLAKKVISFKEKPDLVTAKEYISSGNYYWNGGMFMFSIATMQDELTKYMPAIIDITKNGYQYAVDNFVNMPDISIDYAVAEKSQKMMMIPMENIYWNDIGSFDAIAEVLSDKDKNVFKGDILAENCTDTMIIGDNRLIAGIDLENLMIIDTPDALLVAKKGESQKVKNIVNKLKQNKRKEAKENVTMYRSWGKYTLLTESEGYRVRKIEMDPGASLTMQMHYHRSEHWTVISGTGKIIINDKESIFTENQSTYIPMGVKHKLSNPGKIPLIIIEVQSGKYINDDDIVVFGK